MTRRLVLATVVALVAGVVWVIGGPLRPAAAAAPPGASRFVAITPERVLDTRSGYGTTVPGKPGIGGSVTLQITGQAGIPATATAVVLNVTATEANGAGFVTVYPAGVERPWTSSLNLEEPGQTVPNLVTVGIGAGGQVELFTMYGTHLVADAFGYYEPATTATAGRFTPLGPIRTYDSREGPGIVAGQETRRVSLAGYVPADASAVVLNVTVDAASGVGFWTVYPGGTPRPFTSNLNVDARGQTVANQVIVPIADTSVDVFSQAGGHVIVDVAGYFTGATAGASSNGLFVPRTPDRLLDTRESNNPLGAGVRPSQGWTVEVPVVGRLGDGGAIGAVVMNATYVHATRPGFVTAYPAGTPRPWTSSVNATRARQVVANHAVIPVAARGVALFTQTGGHLVMDVTGYYTGTPMPSPQPVPVNPPRPLPTMPVQLDIPALGRSDTVYEGIDDATLVGGPGFWPGTALPGQAGNTVIFGHRTSNTRPFRYLDLLPPGSPIVITTDEYVFTYEVMGQSVTSGDDVTVVTWWPGTPAVTLVACHPPGSITYRIVVRGALATWSYRD